MGFDARGILGDRAERKALHFLVREGLKPVTQNFRSRGGEIDLIMLHCDCLVFVEVRYRKSTRFASPASTVDRQKQRKIVRTAAMFIARKPHYARLAMRFDVVAITAGVDGTIEWVRDAFRPINSTL
jgi:putative endonuclease